MNFHSEFTPKPFSTKITHQQKILLMGSCFTENMGAKLMQHKFSTLQNPNGILFNPINISSAVSGYIANQKFTEDDLFYHNECWHSWAHHSRFSNPDKAACLQGINQSQQHASKFIKEADWLMITLGSAFAYTLNFSGTKPMQNLVGKTGDVVANCHKIPTDKFDKKLFNCTEIMAGLQQTLAELLVVNPTIKVIFTISPVRHLREGMVENNRSKAMLIQAVHELVDVLQNVFYFPAYELVIDDLRDYRFYAEDMVHPNYAATNYVWEKFVQACIDEPGQLLMKEINLINAAKSHKPFNPSSQQHKKFLQLNLEKVMALNQLHPHLNFEEEKVYFK